MWDLLCCAVCRVKMTIGSFGIVFDIDGVLLRGENVIPGAIDAVKKVGERGGGVCDLLLDI